MDNGCIKFIENETFQKFSLDTFLNHARGTSRATQSLILDFIKKIPEDMIEETTLEKFFILCEENEEPDFFQVLQTLKIKKEQANKEKKQLPNDEIRKNFFKNFSN